MEDLRVELGTHAVPCDVQPKDLMTQQVLAVAEARGDRDGPRGAEGSEFIRTPRRRLVWLVAPLVDLDPDVTRVAFECGAAAGALGDVGHDRAGVGRAPLVPLELSAVG